MWKNWQADAYYHSIEKVPLENYYKQGYRLLLLDIDNTLAIHGSQVSQAYAQDQLRRVREIGYDVYVLSNALRDRAQSFGKSLDPKLKVIGDARKPGTRGIEEALAKANIPREQALLVGDQIFTDVWAGKRANIRVVQVDPLSLNEPWYIRLKRMGERLVRFISGNSAYYDRILAQKEQLP